MQYYLEITGEGGSTRKSLCLNFVNGIVSIICGMQAKQRITADRLVDEDILDNI